MKRKLVLILIIMIFAVQSIGALSALATGDGESISQETGTYEETTPPIPEANISVKITNYDEDDRIYKDDDFEIDLSITADTDIDNIYITVDNSSAFYIPSNEDQIYPIENITEDEDGKIVGTVEIPLRYKGTGNELILNIKYTKDGDSGNTTATLYIDNVRDENDDKDDEDEDIDTTKYKPSIMVWGNTQMPVLEAGKKSTIPFYIKNQSQYNAKDITISLEAADDSPAIIFDTVKVIKTLEKLDADESKDLYFPVEMDPTVETGIYSLTVSMSYTNRYNDAFEASETIRIKVENNDSSPEISVASVENSPEVITPGQGAKLKLQLKNMGTLTAKDIKVSLTGLKGDGFIAADGIAEKHIDEIAGGGTQIAEFNLICAHTIEDGYKELGVKLEYKNTKGEAESHDSQIFLPVALSGDMSELRESGEEGAKTVPRLIVNQYNLSDSAVKAGQKIGVSLSFLNTSQQMPIRNLKATFTSADGVFSTEGSNSFFVQEVGPGNSFQKDINVFAKPDAEPKIYNLSIKLEYEDDKGNPYTSEELISIPVQQDAKLVLGDLNLAPENYVGQPIPVFVEFYNMGKATLYNLMIKVEGDFEEAKPSYYVGNFESGRSDYFDAMLTINTPRKISGRVLFTFEDSAGNPTEIAKEFVLDVTEMPAPPDMGKGEYPGMEPPMETKNNNKIWIWGGSIAGAVIIVIVIIILRKRHNKKKEMMFDEAI